MATKIQLPSCYCFKDANASHQSLIQTLKNNESVFINHTSQLDFSDDKIVFLNNARYLNPEDADTILALKAIKQYKIGFSK